MRLSSSKTLWRTTKVWGRIGKRGYRTNVDAYPEWQAWMRERQPRLLVIWGKYDVSFDLGEPERFRKDVPDAQVHILDAGHFALDTAADEIALLVRNFAGSSVDRRHVPMEGASSHAT